VISDGSAVRWIGQLLQVGCALAAAAMRPRNFEDLINACLLLIPGEVARESGMMSPTNPI
jgi:hypothetical protein